MAEEEVARRSKVAQNWCARVTIGTHFVNQFVAQLGKLRCMLQKTPLKIINKVYLQHGNLFQTYQQARRTVPRIYASIEDAENSVKTRSGRVHDTCKTWRLAGLRTII